jgi:hypothetical protein
MKRAILSLLAAALLAALAAGLTACAQTKSLARVHPEQLQGPPRCSECHTEGYAVLDHTDDFDRRHRFFAVEQAAVCATCHKPSFCADCHGNKEELKPSDKYKDSPQMAMPHRGDYLIQHRIDGNVNPAPCFKCHGRKDEWRCRKCHR